ncbi:ran-binding protein 3-like isoform X1 [Paramormyrops kingsleyae]|uniref:Ran-binding protein 3 n=1 Tax=Paramormyrops kingsleyae TaxID=1676925 RepID=A0A3B3R1L5_9TELE|nr:ran-binding protein 3-like isoform X1 [Paramormyrops kingsleyae]
MADLANEEKPALAPPVFVFQKDKAQKRSADGSSAEDGEDSDKEDSGYCPPVKRERTSSLTQFPPSHSVSKNNVFMPSSFCQSPTGNSDSEPEEKTAGFRLKPPTLIHGQAPSAGVPSQKPKAPPRSVLRPALLQPPPLKSFTASGTDSSSGTNGLSNSSDAKADGWAPCNDAGDTERIAMETTKPPGTAATEDRGDKPSIESSFVFGQNLKERVKVDGTSQPPALDDPKQPSPASDSQSGATNYFLQYINTPSSQDSVADCDGGAKFVFGQNMSERVLSLPKGSDLAAEDGKEIPSVSEPPTQEAASENGGGAAGSLEASAAAYTKATAKRCLLEKVEVITGEEAESNVLQIQCKLFVFDKTSQSWVERGRGLLRLNDMASADDGTLQSRLVMRTQGSLRLILNTKLWPQMQVDKASEKSIRVTAMDTEDQGVKVFLISASSKDTGQLAAALHHRILALRSRAEQESESRPEVAEPQVPQSNEEDSEEDDVLIAPSSSTTPSAGTSEDGEAQVTGTT